MDHDDVSFWLVRMTGEYSGDTRLAEELVTPAYYQPQIGHRIFMTAWSGDDRATYFTTPVRVVEVVVHTQWDGRKQEHVEHKRVRLVDAPTLIVEPAP